MRIIPKIRATLAQVLMGGIRLNECISKVFLIVSVYKVTVSKTFHAKHAKEIPQRAQKYVFCGLLRVFFFAASA
jgi:hypothetical protein